MSFNAPEFYNYPIMFTLQKNAEVRNKQLMMWSDFICAYCQFNKIHTIGITELYNSSICVNNTIERRMSLEFLNVLLEYMIKSGII